jgi:hypothetical protein
MTIRSIPMRLHGRLRAMGKIRCAFGIVAGLLLLNSCATTATTATTPRPAPLAPPAQRPADVAMNTGAGSGAWLFVNLRLQDGEELPFFIDTGSNYTSFDNSLAPRLGKRIATVQGRHYDDVITLDSYPAPKLFLGNTPLMMGERVLTTDLSKPSADARRPVMGILGMDCLRHYCVQLDFAAGKLRFLDPDAASGTPLGQAYPMTFRSGLPWMREVGLVPEAKTPLLIDTGNIYDGALEGELFAQKVRDRTLQLDASSSSTKAKPRTASLPAVVWNGTTYPDIQVRGGVNSIGLRFLARHLVTINSPRQTIYLQRTSADPLK